VEVSCHPELAEGSSDEMPNLARHDFFYVILLVEESII